MFRCVYKYNKIYIFSYKDFYYIEIYIIYIYIIKMCIQYHAKHVRQLYLLHTKFQYDKLKMWNMYKVTSCLVHHRSCPVYVQRLHRDHFLSVFSNVLSRKCFAKHIISQFTFYKMFSVNIFTFSQMCQVSLYEMRTVQDTI